jgi:cytidine deaminase
MANVELVLPGYVIPSKVTDTPSGRLVAPEFEIAERRVSVDADRIAALVASAREAADRAYAPFSNFPVGAALLMDDDPAGEIISGCNVENSSYGATVCAERTAIFSAAAKGYRKLRWLAVTTPVTREAPLRDRSPCGVCRQVIREFAADADTLVICDLGDERMIGEVFDIERLLPFGFRFEPGS